MSGFWVICITLYAKDNIMSMVIRFKYIRGFDDFKKLIITNNYWFINIKKIVKMIGI